MNNKYIPICVNPPAALYGGSNTEPLASMGMSCFLDPMGDKFCEGVSILDYGCGAGILANHISKQLKNFTYYGLEPQSKHGEERLSLAKQYISDPRCSFGFIEHELITTLKKKIDSIILISVFTHLEDRDIINTLDSLCRVFDHNPECDIIFSCFLSTEKRLVNFMPHIWSRFFGESYIPISVLENYCKNKNLSLTHCTSFLAQGNYMHEIFRIKKL
jgi:2-polyprenyl-3-methyl-5-hydroxy-6-metoxy-1,4-benzoquinol methylase